MTEFLRVLDALHRRYRQRAGTGLKRGSPPRLRYLCLDESTSEAVANLPINAYDGTWYGSLKGLKKDECGAKAPYDFTIDQSVIECVASSHLHRVLIASRHSSAIADFRPVQLEGLTYV